MGPDPAELAARHVPGVGAPELERLRNGLVNETYRVRRDGKSYALRVPSERGQPGADRSWECRVVTAAAGAGLAPPVHFCEPAAGVLVSGWIDGRTPGPHDLEGPGLARVAGLIRRVHALDLPLPVRAVTPSEWVELYTAQLRQQREDDEAAGPAGTGAAARRLRRAADDRLNLLARQPSPQTALCHGDVHRLNLVDTGVSLLLLDWEYSHVTDPYWDLASLCSSADFGVARRLELLRAYGGCDPTPMQCLRFDLLAWLYDYVCLAWSGLAGSGAEAGRARFLADRLDAYPVVARADLRHTTRPGGNNGELNGADDRGGSRR